MTRMDVPPRSTSFWAGAGMTWCCYRRASRSLTNSNKARCTLILGPAESWTLNNWFGVLVAGIPCAFDAYCELPGSSGLISLVYAPGTQPQLLRSTPYNVCHGVFNHSNDCLANKGFVAFTIQWHGNPLHIYNTHLDAGRDLRDRSVRAASTTTNWRQLSLLSPTT